MAFGKARNARRSSATSYTSTITTVVFVALCILGVWMLTSNSLVPPQATTRTGVTTTSDVYSSSDAVEPTKPEDPIDVEKKPQPESSKESSATESGKPNGAIAQGNSSDQNKNVEETNDVIKIPAGSVVQDNPQGKESLEEQQKWRERQTQLPGGSSVPDNHYQPTKAIVETNQTISIQNISAIKGTAPPKRDDMQQIQGNGTAIANSNSPNTQMNQTGNVTSSQQAGSAAEPSQIMIREAVSEAQKQHDEAPVESNPAIVADQRNPETQPQTRVENPEIKRQGNVTGSESNMTKQAEEKPIKPNSGIPEESSESKKSWSTQANQSENQMQRWKGDGQDASMYGYTWQLCNVSVGPDYIPCLDNEKALRHLRTTRHYEHRERHCPKESPTCLVPLPEGYKKPVEWPASRDRIWYQNVPHTELVEVKGHQNWVKLMGEFLTFPGGGTQFIHGARHYIDFIGKAVPEITWGKRSRVVLDVGCGVASFGGYLFEKEVLTMSFAPKDEHEAQVQFALERGIPAISAVMGTQRLPFPCRVFDLVHCARCRVPWHAEGGTLLLELNRVLRPGGYFVWSATPVYNKKNKEDTEIWKAMSALTKAMCWELVTIKKDKINSVAAAIYKKPTSNDCYDQRRYKRPPMCRNNDDPNAAWYVPLRTCLHRLPVEESKRGKRWPEDWPHRLQTPPYWLNRSQMGIYGKPAPDDFVADYEHWKKVVSKSYLSNLGISWAHVRNIMDMRAVYGGFAAALKDLKVWVMNVVNIDSPDTLPIIYERGLFGIYHDWCESFSTYPRTYDLLHADHLFSRLKKRCKMVPVMAEVDRIVRPGGKLIVRDESSIVGEVENLLKSLRWEIHLTYSTNHEAILSAQKSDWRPDSYAPPS